MNKSGKIVLASALLCLVSACDRKPSSQTAASSFGVTTAPAPQSRCASGGMGDADNPNCKRQGDANFNKFIGKGGGS